VPRRNNAANPFPTPRYCQDDQENAGWDEVHEEGERRVPESLAFAKDIEREEADEACE